MYLNAWSFPKKIQSLARSLKKAHKHINIVYLWISPTNCNEIIPFEINYIKFLSSGNPPTLNFGPKIVPKHHFCSDNGSKTLPNTWRLYKSRSLHSIATPRYDCNVSISNIGDIRKPYPLFRPQNEPKIPVYTSNGSETFLNTGLLYMNGLPQPTVTHLYKYKEIILNLRIFRPFLGPKWAQNNILQ